MDRLFALMDPFFGQWLLGASTPLPLDPWTLYPPTPGPLDPWTLYPWTSLPTRTSVLKYLEIFGNIVCQIVLDLGTWSVSRDSETSLRHDFVR